MEKYKSLIFPFFIFLGSLLASVSLAYYFKYNTDLLSRELFYKTAESITYLMDQQTNTYKSIYYKLQPTLTQLYEKNNNSFNKITFLEDMFYQPQQAFIVEEQDGISKTQIVKGTKEDIEKVMKSIKERKVNSVLLEEAIEENSTKFIVDDNFITIIPIHNKDNLKTYAVAVVEFRNLVSTPESSNLLDNYIKMDMNVMNDDETKVLYSNNNSDKETNISVKRQRDSYTYTHSIDLGSSHIHIVFNEIKGSNITDLIRDFSTMVNLVGSTFSILFFIIVYSITHSKR